VKLLDDTPPENRDLAAESTGDGGTVVRLFLAHAERLSRTLRRKLPTPEDAQDATQEAFLRLWRQESRGQLRQDAIAYMHSAAQSAAIDCNRRRLSHGADRIVELDFDALEHPFPSKEEELHWREGVEMLVSSLTELPIVVQQVFILYHFEGANHAGIASKLGISIRSVERHMARALAHCKERLKDYL
jgi:RNA polymerase sigma factor (sigma-70 family)